MELKTYLRQMYDYTFWANKRYVAVAEALSDEQLRRKQGHSWDSVHGVLLHMLSSETRWLMRWGGEAPRGHLAPEDFPTLARVTEKWASVEKELRDFLEAFTFFRKSLDETAMEVAQKGDLSSEEAVEVWELLSNLADQVLLAIAEAFEEAATPVRA